MKWTVYLLLHKCLVGSQQAAQLQFVQAAEAVTLHRLRWQRGRCTQLHHIHAHIMSAPTKTTKA